MTLCSFIVPSSANAPLLVCLLSVVTIIIGNPLSEYNNASRWLCPPIQQITFDFTGHTLSNALNNRTITNNGGDITFVGGTISSNAEYATVDVNSGTFTMTGGEIIATGTRQAIYINGGSVTITGSSYLSSQTSGKPTGNSQLDRGTVQCVSGSLTITGGTIISTNFNAVNNAATMTIGTKDGNVNSNSPLIQGGEYGITSTAKYNYYDGIMKGKTAGVDDISKIIDITFSV